VFVLDCFFELTLVGSSKTLAIILLDTILVAEGSESQHTGAISLESDGFSVDDESVAKAALITAKQIAVDGQKQVQRNFSMDHKLFKKFWQLVLCLKYQGKGYGEEVEAYMQQSQTFLDDEQQYNMWK
jgi:hypothetical protein